MWAMLYVIPSIFKCLSDTLGKGEGNFHHVGTEFQISSLVSLDS